MRVARHYVNGLTPRNAGERKQAMDAIADLRDYCTNPETRCTTPIAGLAISGMYRAYSIGDKANLSEAYAALHRLRERNSDTFGQDIPVNHATVCKRFRDVLDNCQCALERDYPAEVNQALRGRTR